MNVALPHTGQTLNEVTVTATPPTFKMSHGMFQANIQRTAYSQFCKGADARTSVPTVGMGSQSVAACFSVTTTDKSADKGL